jgi:hypothetical protein
MIIIHTELSLLKDGSIVSATFNTWIKISFKYNQCFKTYRIVRKVGWNVFDLGDRFTLVGSKCPFVKLFWPWYLSCFTNRGLLSKLLPIEGFETFDLFMVTLQRSQWCSAGLAIKTHFKVTLQHITCKMSGFVNNFLVRDPMLSLSHQ